MNISSSPSLKKVSIHEACHAIVGRLFKKYLEIGHVTLVQNGKFLGENFIKSVSFDSVYTPASMGIVWLAGIVGNSIENTSFKQIMQEKEILLKDPSLLDWSLAGVDKDQFDNNKTHVERQHQVDPGKFQEFCLGFVMDFLTDEEVWPFVEELADHLLSKPDLTLTRDELNAFFTESGVDAMLEKKRTNLVERLGTMITVCKRDDPFTTQLPDVDLF